MSKTSDWIDAFAGVKLVVLGDIMLDRYTFGDSNRISPEAPTPVFRAQRVAEMVGGAGNVARNIASLGGQAVLVGMIGQDATGDALLAGIETTEGMRARLVRSSAGRTAVKNRFVAKGQQVLRVDEEDIVSPPDTVRAEITAHLETELADADAMILSDYAKGVLDRSLIETACAIAAQHGLPVIADPKSRDLSLYRGATLITPNAKETEEATGLSCDTDEGAQAAAAKIAEQTGCAHTVVTRGPQGMTVHSADGRTHHWPTAAREVFDVSGAGDTVVAALGLALAAKAPIAAAAELANRAAGVVVGKIGTATVSARELHAALHHDPADGHRTVDLHQAVQTVRTWQAQGERVVFTNGCFDLVHPGHVSLIRQAKAQGDRLIVALNSDASVKRLKGPSRPVQDEMSRATVIEALRDVDLVVIFEEDTPLDVITALKPDVLVKGADYTVDTVVGADVVQAHGGEVVLVALVEGHSTTGAIARAGQNGHD